jgi:hypothetical protein
MKPAQKFNALTGYALAFGLFLGLAIVKFGNPVILDQKISPPASFSELITDFWPSHWAIWVWLPFALAGGWLIWRSKPYWKGTFWLWLLPLIWLGWQLLAATATVDVSLTSSTLAQFVGCAGCYFIGVMLLGRPILLRWLLAGILAAFTFCLIRAVDQRLFEYPMNYQNLVEGERSGWTNLPPEVFLEMKQENIIVNTNGIDVANPAILAKFTKGRVSGTLVYPNALAGIILLLLPPAVALAFKNTRSLKPLIRGAVIAMTIGLGGMAFIFTGSKLGWLLAMGLGGLMLFRLNWSTRLKWLALGIIVVVGLGIFAVRFHKYFAAGATSAGARIDYWRAAAQTAQSHPLLGTGPGTFQRPYASLKAPGAEMARLTHNDYLEQFSDSGLIGGLSYLSWIVLALIISGRRLWRGGDPLSVALFAGVLAWFIQGFGEFSLYIPALAWTAFTLMGCLAGLATFEFDKKAALC